MKETAAQPELFTAGHCVTRTHASTDPSLMTAGSAVKGWHADAYTIAMSRSLLPGRPQVADGEMLVPAGPDADENQAIDGRRPASPAALLGGQTSK
jgi:hypothetical protein